MLEVREAGEQPPHLFARHNACHADIIQLCWAVHLSDDEDPSAATSKAGVISRSYSSKDHASEAIEKVYNA